MVGKLHTYSPQNTLLIMAQRPDATQVMGYGDKEGRTYELAPDPMGLDAHLEADYEDRVSEDGTNDPDRLGGAY